MSAGSSDSVTLELGGSRALAGTLAAVYLGAAAIAVLSPIAPFARLAVVAAVSFGFYRSLALHALRRSPQAVIRLTLMEDDDCAIERRGAAGAEQGRVIERWVHARLAILVVRTAARRRSTSVVIAADAVAPEAFRRLRVRLLQQPSPARGRYRAPRSADRETDSRA